MERFVSTLSWQLIAADTAAFASWSSGIVQSLDDLYSPVVFGPKGNLSCACGALQGITNLRKVCSICNVPVLDNVEALHRRRLGHLPLNTFIYHPLAPGEMIHQFPIAPIAYRRNKERLTPLGAKYESLLRAVLAFKEESPPIGSAQYFRDIKKLDTSTILRTLHDLIGVPTDGLATLSPTSLVPGTLLFEIVAAALRLDPDLCWLIRAAGCELEVRAKL